MKKISMILELDEWQHIINALQKQEKQGRFKSLRREQLAQKIRKEVNEKCVNKI
jgi:hypothetical protein